MLRKKKVGKNTKIREDRKEESSRSRRILHATMAERTRELAYFKC